MIDKQSRATLPLRRPGGLAAMTSKTWAVLRITLASRLAYMGEVLVRTIFMVLVLYTFTQLWQATNQSQDVLSATGFNISQLIWYLAFTEAITLSVSRMDREVDREVRSGDLAYRIARPLPYPLYHLGASLGDRVLRFVLNLLVGIGVALVFVGPVQITFLGLIAGLSTALVAFVVDFVYSFSISLLSFWVEDTDGLHLLYSRCAMILGGLLIPLDAYPDWLGNIARALPFQYLVYQPARLFVQGDVSQWLNVIAVQLLLVGIGLIPLVVLYRAGLQRVSAQGG
jgi:ABC-2 type transport system permease protein